jgi:glycosyltransferase involved in cell wall biosynthesis
VTRTVPAAPRPEPLVSCVVPVFNGERYLREALDSILAQSYPSIDVVVVDDGSTDGTAGVLADYRARIRTLSQANAGPATARNRGLAAAAGDLIAFLDADDLWHPDKLARQVRRFEARPELDACVTLVQNFWMPEVSAEQDRFRSEPRGRPVPGYVTQTLLARRGVFDAVGAFDARLRHGDGTEWFLRAREAGAVVELLEEVLVYRRLHAGNRSRRHAGRSREEYLRLVKQSLDRRRERGP